MFQAPPAESVLAPTPAPPTQPVQPQTRPAAGKPNYIPLFIGLGILLVLAIVLILIFALRN
jgi:hypothetical protein